MHTKRTGEGDDAMRIQLIHPWPIDDAMAAYEREFVPDDVEITGLKQGLKGSRSNIDRNLTALFDAITDAERQGYDAVVVACLSDPGVEAARELVRIPVLGPLNVGLHIAQIVGRRTLILVTDASRLGRSVMRDLAHQYGLEQRVVIRGIEAQCRRRSLRTGSIKRQGRSILSSPRRSMSVRNQ